MKYISICKNTIAHNYAHKLNNPPIRISEGKEDRNPVYAHEIRISGPSRMLYSPLVPIIKTFGVHLALETEAVEIIS